MSPQKIKPQSTPSAQRVYLGIGRDHTVTVLVFLSALCVLRGLRFRFSLPPKSAIAPAHSAVHDWLTFSYFLAIKNGPPGPRNIARGPSGMPASPAKGSI